MKISECMKRNVVSVHHSIPLREAAGIFARRHVGLLPVVDDEGCLVGVLGLRSVVALAMPAFVKMIADIDFVRDFGAMEAGNLQEADLARPVSDFMRAATSVEAGCGLLRAYALMLQADLHDLPVVDEVGRLVGIASRVDIGTAFLAGERT